MHRRYSYLFGIFLVALMSLCATVGLAGSITKIPASAFNQTTKTFYYAPKVYDIADGDVVVVEIDLSHLTFNTSTSGAKAVLTLCKDPDSAVSGLDMVFFGNGALDVNYQGSKVFGSTWVADKTYTVKLSLADDGTNTRVRIYEGNDLKWDGEVSGAMEVGVIGASGDANSCTDGYVEVTWSSETQLIDMDWAMALVVAIVPVFVIVALLKALLKPLERV